MPIYGHFFEVGAADLFQSDTPPPFRGNLEALNWVHAVCDSIIRGF